MATNTFVDLRLGEASDLAALTGIQWDLRTAQDFARKMKGVDVLVEGGGLEMDAFMTAVIIRYGRPFKHSNARKKIERIELEKLLTAGQMQWHNSLIEMRDKYIAHSDNDFEESAPHARYIQERPEEGIISIGCNHTRVVGLSGQNIDWLLILTEIILKYVSERISEEQKRLLDLVRSMPLEDILPPNTIRPKSASKNT